MLGAPSLMIPWYTIKWCDMVTIFTKSDKFAVIDEYLKLIFQKFGSYLARLVNGMIQNNVCLFF